MGRISTPLTVLALLAGCGEAPPSRQPAPKAASAPPVSAPDAPAAEPPTSDPITQVGDLVGEYRVAGIDGEPLYAPIGIALSIDGPMISFEPTCAGFVWTIAFDGDRLVTERYSPPDLSRSPSPRSICATGILPEQTRLGDALDAVTRAARTPENGIRLSGGGRSVTLFSQ